MLEKALLFIAVLGVVIARAEVIREGVREKRLECEKELENWRKIVNDCVLLSIGEEVEGTLDFIGRLDILKENNLISRTIKELSVFRESLNKCIEILEELTILYERRKYRKFSFILERCHENQEGNSLTNRALLDHLDTSRVKIERSLIWTRKAVEIIEDNSYTEFLYNELTKRLEEFSGYPQEVSSLEKKIRQDISLISNCKNRVSDLANILDIMERLNNNFMELDKKIDY